MAAARGRGGRASIVNDGMRGSPQPALRAWRGNFGKSGTLCVDDQAIKNCGAGTVQARG